MILKIFLLGALVTVPVFLIQVGLADLLKQWQLFSFFSTHPIILQIILWFFIIAGSEEILKFLVVKLGVFGSWALDEPLDIMLYMVVAALGFAAVENILYLFSPIDNVSLGVIVQTAATITFIRFVGSTFLHTLCSGLLGYFLALSTVRNKGKFKLAVTGMALAIFFHGLYDFSIITLKSPYNILAPVAIIVALMIFMLWDFNEIKKVKSICKI